MAKIEAIKKTIATGLKAYFGTDHSFLVGLAINQPDVFYIDDRVEMTKAEQALLELSAKVLELCE